jgi:hypothetical protein
MLVIVEVGQPAVFAPLTMWDPSSEINRFLGGSVEVE